MIDRLKHPSFLHIPNALIVFEDIKLAKAIMGRPNQHFLQLGLRICINMPGEQIAIVE
jgi:hypothetical protein